MKKIIFATNNAHKLEELRAIVGEHFEVLSLSDIGCHDDIPENAPTIAGNALAKARWVHERYGIDCFADDTGLCVDALNGAPGVHSARYAPGTSHDAEANMHYLLKNLADVPADKRSAHFTTVIALIQDGKESLFEGRVDGTIIDTPRGTNGFGYDPIFVPVGYTQTFAELSAEAKNSISHRGRATKKLIEHLLKE